MAESLRRRWMRGTPEERAKMAKPHLTGKECFENNCSEPAGTPWGALWCPKHDDERIERISRNLDEIGKGFGCTE